MKHFIYGNCAIRHICLLNDTLLVQEWDNSCHVIYDVYTYHQLCSEEKI